MAGPPDEDRACPRLPSEARPRTDARTGDEPGRAGTRTKPNAFGLYVGLARRPELTGSWFDRRHDRLMRSGRSEQKPVSAHDPPMHELRRSCLPMLNRAKTIEKIAGHGPRSIPVGMVLGAVAGAAGGWAMDRVGWFMYSHEGRDALSPELQTRKGGNDVGFTNAEEAARQRQARPGPAGNDVAHVAVEKVHRLAGIKVRTGQPNRPGSSRTTGRAYCPGPSPALLGRKVRAVRAGGGAVRSGPVRGDGRDGCAAAGTGLRAEAVSLAGPRQEPGGRYGAGRGHRDRVALVPTVPGSRVRAGSIVRSMMGNSEAVTRGSYGRCDSGRPDRAGEPHRVHWPASRWVLRHGAAGGPTSGGCRA